MSVKIRALLLLPVLACMLPAPHGAWADGSPVPDNRVYASAMINSALSGNRSGGRGAGFLIGVGKPITDRFGLELDFQRYKIRMDAGHGGFGVDEKTYGLDGLFYLHRGGRWTPYLAFGAGRADSAYDSGGGSGSGSYLTAGAGFFWRVTDHLSLRGDLRVNHFPNGLGTSADSSAMTYPVASFGIATQFGSPPGARSVPTRSSPDSLPPPPPAPADSDGDGVPDAMDQCPGTPEGVRVGSHGCPIDTDGDGVPDNLDQCPNTPLGVKVDARGCQVKPELKLPTVHFALDSSRLSTAAERSLNRAVKNLDRVPAVDVMLVGYTDSSGPAAYNLKLSKARASSVKHYLVARGVAESRLHTRGDGESHPVASNKTAAGRAKNRRVELHVMKDRSAQGTQ